MATRVEEIFEAVTAALGDADPTYLTISFWGKRLSEARKPPPAIEWIELDDGETVEDPIQHEGDDSQSCAMRLVPVQLNCIGKDSAVSEDIFHAVLAAIHNTCSRNGYGWGQVKKGGERPNSGPHVRAIVIVFRIPVLAEEYELRKVSKATLIVRAEDTAGEEDPEQGLPLS